MSIEERLKEYILTRYDSVTEFCLKSGIASSTIFTVFKRGIKNTSTNTIIKICNALSLDVTALSDGKIVEIYASDKIEKPVDISRILVEIEESRLTYRGIELNDQQKRMIAYATKIALNMALKDFDS